MNPPIVDVNSPEYIFRDKFMRKYHAYHVQLRSMNMVKPDGGMALSELTLPSQIQGLLRKVTGDNEIATLSPVVRSDVHDQVLSATPSIITTGEEITTGGVPSAPPSIITTGEEITTGGVPSAPPSIITTGGVPSAPPSIITTGGVPSAHPSIITTGGVPSAHPSIITTGEEIRTPYPLGHGNLGVDSVVTTGPFVQQIPQFHFNGESSGINTGPPNIEFCGQEMNQVQKSVPVPHVEIPIGGGGWESDTDTESEWTSDTDSDSDSDSDP